MEQILVKAQPEAITDARSGRAAAHSRHKGWQAWQPVLLVMLLWAFHAVGVYLWLAANQFATGWDRPKHLVSTLLFDRMLQPVNIVTLFQVFSLNIGYYPPLFPLSVVPLYRLFGVSADVAGMVNVVYMLILLLSLYGIGAKLYDARTGLLAAFLGSMSPFLFSMAHYTYIDYALTAMTTLTVCLLLCADRFRRAACSILFGVALGLAMLYKWTPVLFVSGPLLLVVAGMVKDDWRRAQTPDQRRVWKPALWWVGQLIVAAAAGLLLTWLWHAPNADLAATLFLGAWLPVLSVLLIGGTVFALLLPGRPAFNVLKSLALAALIMSCWYAPRADMFRDIVSIVAGGRADRPNYLSLAAYLYYPDRLINQGLGWPLSVLVAVLLAMAIYRFLFGRASGMKTGPTDAGMPVNQKRRVWKPALHLLDSSDLFVLLWLALPFIVATFSTHREVRSLLPLMPPVVVAVARLLIGIPHRALRRTIIGVVGVYLVVQFAVLNLSALAPVAAATQFDAPLLGRVGLFAHGEHIAWANRGEHDDGYWIVPDVLQTITSDVRRVDRASMPDEQVASTLDGSQGVRQGAVVLGLLLNSRAANEYTINYVVQTEYPEVVLNNLCQNRDRYPVYARLFSCDYLLMRDVPDSSEPAELVRTLLGAPPASFTDNFSLARTYLWPNGQTIYLFKNETHTIPDSFGAELLSPIERVVEIDLGDTLRLLGYNMDASQVPERGKLLLTLYWMGLKRPNVDYTMSLKLLNGVRHVWGEQQGRPRWDASLTSKWARGEVVEDIRELPVWPGTPPGSYTVEVLVAGVQNGIPLEPADGAELLLGPVELPAGPVPAVRELDLDRALDVAFGDQVKLLGYKLESGWGRGDGVHLTLYWQALRPIDQDYVVFNHLTGADGATYAQQDNPPVDGYYSTARWVAGEVVRDRYDLVIPADAPAQSYTIETGLYLPDTGQRLAVTNEIGQAVSDKVTLRQFEITGR